MTNLKIKSSKGVTSAAWVLFSRAIDSNGKLSSPSIYAIYSHKKRAVAEKKRMKKEFYMKWLGYANDNCCWISRHTINESEWI